MFSPFTFSIHNWRKFDTVRVSLQHTPLCIVDTNGSGKTSLLASIYSLLTFQPWPELSFKNCIKYQATYFGINYNDDWYISGTLSESGRLKLMTKNDYNHMYKVITYLPNDNMWMFLSRTQKLSILDTLLVQVYGDEYSYHLKKISIATKNKTSLLKRFVEFGIDDPILAQEYTKIIYTSSTVVWKLRDRYFDLVTDHINEYISWIDSNNTIELKHQRTIGKNRLYTTTNATISEPDYTTLWQNEKVAQRVVYGAQRDDFEFFINNMPITSVLSRGEMRLFVLFLKQIGKSLFEHQDKVIWLLDDVFNEFDNKREMIVLDSILSKSGTFIATSTRTPHNSVTSTSLSEILTFL